MFSLLMTNIGYKVHTFVLIMNSRRADCWEVKLYKAYSLIHVFKYSKHETKKICINYIPRQDCSTTFLNIVLAFIICLSQTILVFLVSSSALLLSVFKNFNYFPKCFYPMMYLNYTFLYLNKVVSTTKVL